MALSYFECVLPCMLIFRCLPFGLGHQLLLAYILSMLVDVTFVFYNSTKTNTKLLIVGSLKDAAPLFILSGKPSFRRQDSNPKPSMFRLTTSAAAANTQCLQF